MNLSGLSPEKAPPVAVPLGLFLMLPVFLVLAGAVLVCYGGDALATRWSPAALAGVHLLVLGGLAPVMCGALFQVAPVLLGTPFPAVRPVALVTGASLGTGALALAAGFLTGSPDWLLAGGVLAASGLGVFLIAATAALWSRGGRGETTRAVRLALVALALTTLLGLSLVGARHGDLDLPYRLAWVDVHAAWGIGGWIGLLLVGVAMDLLPMFYVTGGFGERLRRWLVPGAFGLLVAVSLLYLAMAPALSAEWLFAAALAPHLVFLGQALRREKLRRRPRRDPTLTLWQSSHGMIVAALAASLLGDLPVLNGVLLLGAGTAFVVGSLFKIVPFLSWLDLQQRRMAAGAVTVRLPRLNELWPDKGAVAVTAALATALAVLAAASAWPPATSAGGGALVLAGAMLGYYLLRANRLRLETLRRFRTA